VQSVRLSVVWSANARLGEATKRTVQPRCIQLLEAVSAVAVDDGGGLHGSWSRVLADHAQKTRRTLKPKNRHNCDSAGLLSARFQPQCCTILLVHDTQFEHEWPFVQTSERRLLASSTPPQPIALLLLRSMSEEQFEVRVMWRPYPHDPSRLCQLICLLRLQVEAILDVRGTGRKREWLVSW
jgi:hypothetical protein